MRTVGGKNDDNNMIMYLSIGSHPRSRHCQQAKEDKAVLRKFHGGKFHLEYSWKQKINRKSKSHVLGRLEKLRVKLNSLCI